MELETDEKTAYKLAEIFRTGDPVKFTFESKGQSVSVFVSAKSIGVSKSNENPFATHNSTKVNIELDAINSSYIKADIW